MRSIRRPQSLPISIFQANTSSLHQQECLFSELQEVIYIDHHVESDETLVIEKESANTDNQEMSDKIYRSRSTQPLPVPSPPQSRQAEREEELYQELMHVYNNATWKMYHRIQNARKARYLHNRNRSRSEGYKPRDTD